MRRTASEKMEMIRLVEGTDMPVRATLRQLGVPRSTFYRWYQRYVDEGFDGLHDKKPVRRARWNAIPEKIQKQVLDLVLERTDLSPRELAWRYTDERRYFVSESSVYRILKAADLITSPAYILMSASDAFKHVEPGSRRPGCAPRRSRRPRAVFRPIIGLDLLAAARGSRYSHARDRSAFPLPRARNRAFCYPQHDQPTDSSQP